MMTPSPMITPDNSIIFVALESELPADHLPGWKIIYTGVGKVNASIEAIKNHNIYQKVLTNYIFSQKTNLHVSC